MQLGGSLRVASLFVSVSLFFSQAPVPLPTTSQRDPQAAALLQASVRAMGGTVPADSVATGSVIVVAGSQTSTGTIRILTRGTDQSSEQIAFPQSANSLTFSRGFANETTSTVARSLPLERAATSQSVCFPLPFLAAALANADESIQYIALETFGQQSVQHIRIQNTFASQPNFQQLTDFTTFDVWFDAGTGLALRISTIRRDGGGSSPRVAFDVYFSNYQNISGINYPFSIQQSVNGTLWMTVSITGVSFNRGLTDVDFSVARSQK